MPGSLRTFVALALGEADAASLASWAEQALRGVDGLRLVPAANLHATLVFCGMLEPPAREAVAEAVRAEAVGVPLAALEPWRVAVLGSVLAVTYEPAGEAGPLLELQHRLARRLTAAGLAPPEPRRWLPHVTVARARRGVRPRPGTVAPPSAGLSPSGVAAYTTVPVQGGVVYRPIAFIGPDEDTRARELAPDGGG
jgi:2'-5' RNA ligase